MTRASVSDVARTEIRDAARWIAADSPKAASRFRTAILHGLEQIGGFPEIGALRPDLTDRDVRFWPLPDFPYLFVYSAGRRPPLILRVLHGARDVTAVLTDPP